MQVRLADSQLMTSCGHGYTGQQRDDRGNVKQHRPQQLLHRTAAGEGCTKARGSRLCAVPALLSPCKSLAVLKVKRRIPFWTDDDVTIVVMPLVHLHEAVVQSPS